MATTGYINYDDYNDNYIIDNQKKLRVKNIFFHAQLPKESVLKQVTQQLLKPVSLFVKSRSDIAKREIPLLNSNITQSSLKYIIDLVEIYIRRPWQFPRELARADFKKVLNGYKATLYVRINKFEGRGGPNPGVQSIIFTLLPPGKVPLDFAYEVTNLGIITDKFNYPAISRSNKGLVEKQAQRIDPRLRTEKSIKEGATFLLENAKNDKNILTNVLKTHLYICKKTLDYAGSSYISCKFLIYLRKIFNKVIQLQKKGEKKIPFFDYKKILETYNNVQGVKIWKRVMDLANKHTDQGSSHEPIWKDLDKYPFHEFENDLIEIMRINFDGIYRAFLIYLAIEKKKKFEIRLQPEIKLKNIYGNSIIEQGEFRYRFIGTSKSEYSIDSLDLTDKLHIKLLHYYYKNTYIKISVILQFFNSRPWQLNLWQLESFRREAAKLDKNNTWNVYKVLWLNNHLNYLDRLGNGNLIGTSGDFSDRFPNK